MNKFYSLQARSRSLSNVFHPATGEPYDHSMISSQYKDTGLTATKAATARQLLEDARDGSVRAYPPQHFKFRIHRVDLDAPVAMEAAANDGPN